MVVVSVVKFPNGVFTHCPISSFVNVEGRVQEFTFDEWKEAIHKPLRGKSLIVHKPLRGKSLIVHKPLRGKSLIVPKQQRLILNL